MKHGEKKVLLWIAITVISVVAMTVFLEIQYQETHRTESTKASNQSVVDNSNADNEKGTIVIPAGMDPNNLPDAESRGATILTLYCAQCHDLPTPAMHTALEWKEVLGRMMTQIKSRRGGMLTRILMPPEKDWEILKIYLDTHAQSPLDPYQTADLDTPAGKIFQTTCSQCHAAPTPATHTASEWPRVVLRMKSHIIRTGKSMPNQDSLLQIIEYLQHHGKTS